MNKLFNKIANIWKRMPHWSALLIVLILGVGVGVGIFYGVWNYKLKSRYQLPTPVAQDNNQPPSQVVVPTSTSDTSLGREDTIDPTNGYLNYATSTPEIDNRNISVSVSWLKNPVEMNLGEADKFFSVLKLPSEAISKRLYAYPEGLIFQSLWRLGTVKNEAFAGADFYLLETSEEGMVPLSHFSYIILPKDGRLRVFGNDSAYLTDRMINMPNASLNQKVPSGTLIYSNGKKIDRIPSLYFWGSNPAHKFIDFKNATMTSDSISKNGFQLMKQEDLNGVRIVFLDDGSAFYYGSLPPGTKDEKGFLPNITWSDTGKNTAFYKMTETGGCGGSNIPNVVSGISETDLTRIGSTSDGDPVYFPKNPKTNEFVQSVYDQWYLPEGETKPDMDEFLKKYPHSIFFWKNAFGEWVMGQHQDLQPMTECGKPVIYLYPTKTTNVSVKLPDFINVTVSDPAYPSRGWNVVAHPDGSLSYADGKTYGSLYWEGTGVNYQTPREGFVVKDGEQESFLKSTLTKYGLNQKESQEFMDFWLPQMKGSPYYRVSFLVDDWSKAAPLYVSPRPDTNIRIFMDWQKLSAPIKITEPKIATPVRNGFTLVEWGGLLYK